MRKERNIFDFLNKTYGDVTYVIYFYLCNIYGKGVKHIEHIKTSVVIYVLESLIDLIYVNFFDDGILKK